MRRHRKAVAMGTSFLVQGNRPLLTELEHLGISVSEIVREGIITWVELQSESRVLLSMKATPGSVFFDRVYESLILNFSWSNFTYLIDDLIELCMGFYIQFERFLEYLDLSEAEAESINLRSADETTVIIDYLH